MSIPRYPATLCKLLGNEVAQSGQGQRVDDKVVDQRQATDLQLGSQGPQVEGGVVQALGYGVSEEMNYDAEGRIVERDLRDYHIYRSNEMPELQTLFVETFEPTHPFGVKAVAEICLNAAAPAIGNAIFNACDANIDVIPATPERIWRAIN